MAFQYENAPITEALIDLRAVLPDDVTLSTLEALYGRVTACYPRKTKRFQIEGQFSVQTPPTEKQTEIGFGFSSEDGKQIFQATLDGFTFSRLRPYGNWLGLNTEAKRLWGLYRESARPLEVTRVAVRYVNQIDIPLPIIDNKEYFLTSPEVSPSLPQELSGFFMQLQFPQADFGGMLILNQAALPSPEPDVNSIVLDLDVFKADLHLTSEEDIWQLLETLRNRKNEFFEGCITDKTRALFGRRKEYDATIGRSS
jgi:uncharacterized protein (TIGR04255 family)